MIRDELKHLKEIVWTLFLAFMWLLEGDEDPYDSHTCAFEDANDWS